MPIAMLLNTSRDKVVLEIGGPTDILQRAGPFYSGAARVDNVVAAVHKEWPHDSKQSIFTHDYRADGAALQRVAPDAIYDTVVSSHNLEHFPDPMRALLEWHRVLKRGGQLVLIVPYPPRTFDHKRKRHSVKHILIDFLNATRERHTVDLEETFRDWDVEMDPGLGCCNSEQRRERLRSRFHAPMGEHFMHWHVFTPGLLLQLAMCLDMAVVQTPIMWKPFHMLVILRK